ncbi:MAG: terminase small subunit [Oscillospiraceae bacterium]|nr:terminase small subunit [Oscillospiraceae bacterium]
MKMQIGLKREEKLFCYYFAETGDISLSAEKAGFSHDDAFEKGCGILAKAPARKLITKQREFISGNSIDDIKVALRRIIFGANNDAVETVFSDTGEIKSYDLFSVSEIKKVDGKGTEIKLISKIEALKLLYEIEKNGSEKNKAESFISALSSAYCPENEDEDDRI